MSASNWETRHIGFEGRAELTDDKRIRGYAIVFNMKSVDLGGFREIILPSAVDRTLRDGLDVRAYADHDTAKILGRTTSGTLPMRVPTTGVPHASASAMARPNGSWNCDV